VMSRTQLTPGMFVGSLFSKKSQIFLRTALVSVVRLVFQSASEPV
jgi:hypothetical protein